MENKKRQEFRKSKSFPKKRKFSDRAEEKVSKRADNDAAWYAADGQLLKDVSSFSFNSALGAGLTIRGQNASGGLSYTTKFPGILSIMTTPTVGISNSADAPVNVAAKKLYAYVRHANSGHSNYDPADLMIYMLAMDSLYTYWSYMTRVYGVAQIFSKTNRYVGDALLRSMGVDPYSVRSNLADLRAYINMFAVKAGSFAVPKTMSYFIRHSWMYSNIYKDEDTSKAQMYLYVPAFLYKFALKAETGAGMLEATPVCGVIGPSGSLNGITMLTFPQLYFLGDTLLNAALAQEDLGIISGDVLKAYGPENLWKLDSVPEGYAVLPVFSEEMLAQIHNTDFAGVTVRVQKGDEWSINYHGLDVVQDVSVGDGNLYFEPRFYRASHLCHDRILDFWHENPTPEEVMVGTRNMICAFPSLLDAGQRTAEIRGCGSELALCAFMWNYDSNNALVSTQMYFSDQSAALMNISDLSKFNEYPRYYVTNNNGEIASIMGEMDTYTVLTSWEIEQLHLAALLSMFGIPYIK